MKNLRSYVSLDDYTTFAGPDWPSYDDYINGATTDNTRIQQHIDQFTDMMIKEGKRFPIKTTTACQYKWAWSTVYLNYLSSASCHRVKPVPFKIDDFDTFHNLPKKIQDRKLMLEGKWPTGGCEYCRDIEESGGWSDRQHALETRNLLPKELETDSTEVFVTPTIVEIFAKNTCNLACTYCNGSLSSKIEQENKKFGSFNSNGVSIPIINTPAAADEYLEKFYSWLKLNIHQLQRLHLLGGETFIQHDLMNTVLKIIEENPNPNLAFCVFSNFNAPQKYWNLYIDRIKNLQKQKHIRVFDLTASIDCWGDAAEYARSGLDLNKFEENFAWASEQGEWLRLTVNQTVTALTVRTMPDLIKKINQYSGHKHIGHHFQFYTGPQMFQHPQIYSYSLWEQDFKNILDVMPKNTPEQLEAIPRMQGLQAQLMQRNQHDYEEIKKLHVYLDELDRRRNTNWRSIFSYLDVK
jgi:pyruvate-formate lyase-activating enzyme